MREPQPTLNVKGLEIERDVKEAEPVYSQFIDYLIHVNNSMLVFWFTGALLVKLELGNRYEPYTYSTITNGALILCAIKFLVIITKAFIMAKHEMVRKILRYIDIALLIGWAALFVAGEILRLGYDVERKGDFMETYYVTVFRRWCVFFTLIISFYFLGRWLYRKYFSGGRYSTQIDEKMLF